MNTDYGKPCIHVHTYENVENTERQATLFAICLNGLGHETEIVELHDWAEGHRVWADNKYVDFIQGTRKPIKEQHNG